MKSDSDVAVIGGSYGEVCCFPRRTVCRGSGARAAAVLSGLGSKVTFFTVLGPTQAADAKRLSRLIGYRLVSYPGEDDVWFRYRTPISVPARSPNTVRQVPVRPAEVRKALAFGMVEGRIPIHAERVVYDPQDGANASAFESNGSSASELALVASYSEGHALTGANEPVAIAKKLLARPGTIVAIIKCGPRGALVCTPRTSAWVHPFPTGTVYKIGSGDVFSAAFAHAWLTENADPDEAAWIASRVTAAYVSSGRDRFASGEGKQLRREAIDAYRRAGKSSHRRLPTKAIYLAAPFFSSAQQWLVDEVRDSLKGLGFKVFSPIHDVGIGEPEEVAPQNLVALESAGVLLALLDGLDSGTIFEIGYARARRIPVVAVAEAVDATPLTMMLGSGCYLTNDLSTGVHAACWRLMGDV